MYTFYNNIQSLKDNINRKLATEQLEREEADKKILLMARRIIINEDQPDDNSDISTYKKKLRTRMTNALKELKAKVDDAIKKKNNIESPTKHRRTNSSKPRMNLTIDPYQSQKVPFGRRSCSACSERWRTYSDLDRTKLIRVYKDLNILKKCIDGL